MHFANQAIKNRHILALFLTVSRLVAACLGYLTASVHSFATSVVQMSLTGAFRQEKFANRETASLLWCISERPVTIILPPFAWTKQPVAKILPLFTFLVIFNEKVICGNSCYSLQLVWNQICCMCLGRLWPLKVVVGELRCHDFTWLLGLPRRWKEAPLPQKNSSIRSAVSTELRLLTDTDGHGRTRGHGVHRASTGSRGKSTTWTFRRHTVFYVSMLFLLNTCVLNTHWAFQHNFDLQDILTDRVRD